MAEIRAQRWQQLAKKAVLWIEELDHLAEQIHGRLYEKTNEYKSQEDWTWESDTKSASFEGDSDFFDDCGSLWITDEDANAICYIGKFYDVTEY